MGHTDTNTRKRGLSFRNLLVLGASALASLALGAQVVGPEPDAPPPPWLAGYAEGLELRLLPAFVGRTADDLRLANLYLPVPSLPKSPLLRSQSLPTCPPALVFPTAQEAPEALVCGGQAYLLSDQVPFFFPAAFPEVAKAEFAFDEGLPWRGTLLLTLKGEEERKYALHLDAENLFALWERKAVEIQKERERERAEAERAKAEVERAAQAAKAKAEREKAEAAQRFAQVKDLQNLGGRASCIGVWEKERERVRKSIQGFLHMVEVAGETPRFLVAALVPGLRQEAEAVGTRYRNSMGVCFPPGYQYLSFLGEAIADYVQLFAMGSDSMEGFFVSIELLKGLPSLIDQEAKSRNVNHVLVGGRSLAITFLQGFHAQGIRTYQASKGKRLVVVRLRLEYKGESVASGLGWSPAFAGRPLSLNPRALEEVAWLLGIPKQGINKLPSTLEAGKP